MRRPRQITQRELRNDSGEVMRALGRGESFIITSNGIAVGALRPLRETQRSKKAEVLETFRNAPRMDYGRFRDDIDRVINQDLAPRA